MNCSIMYIKLYIGESKFSNLIDNDISNQEMILNFKLSI